jgi:glycosyltransferase involved in cell wall biosynthesis
MSLFISVIIPTFNSERYLPVCLDSIINQIDKNIEVIIVNDGSTDSSCDIADRYAIQYSFIKVIHQSNQGVSAARNRAIRESIGSYLVFLDSDDLLYKGFFQRILELIQNQPDIIEINADLIDEIGLMSYKKVFSFDIDRNTTDSADAAKMRLSKQAKYYLWSRIIRKEIVNHLYFDETITFCEDALYLTECYYRAEKIIAIDESWYGYRQHDSNVTRLKSVNNINQLTKLCNIAKRNVDSSQDGQYRTLFLSLWINMAHLRKSMYALEFKKINSDKVTVQQIIEIKNHDEWSFFKLIDEISWLHRLSITAPKISNVLILLKHYTKIEL